MLITVTGGRVTVNNPSPRVIKLASTGPAGPAGTVLAGFGAWSATTFPLYSCVSYQGSSYISNAATASTDVPGVSAKWVLLASKGDTGSTGSTGSTGNGIASVTWTSSTGGSSAGIANATDTYTVTYTNGATSTFSVKNGTTGATGAQGPQGIQGVTGAAGPKGDTGATGATGSISTTGVTDNQSTTPYNSVQVNQYGQVVTGSTGLRTKYTSVTTTSTTLTSATTLVRVTDGTPAVTTLIVPTPTTALTGTIFYVRNDRKVTPTGLGISTAGGTVVVSSAGLASSTTIMLVCSGTAWINFGISQTK
jgi:hypothetical protein